MKHLFMRTENRVNLEMRCLFCFENITICDAIHAVLIENEKFRLGITKKMFSMSLCRANSNICKLNTAHE